jgi:hypothetical protein
MYEKSDEIHLYAKSQSAYAQQKHSVTPSE